MSASELGRHNITVNAYAPGAVETELSNPFSTTNINFSNTTQVRTADKSISKYQGQGEGTWVQAVSKVELLCSIF